MDEITPTPTLIPPVEHTFTPTPTFTSLPPSDTPTSPPPSDTPTPPLVPGVTQVSSVDGMTLVYTGDFWIDRTEVTNAMYALCVNAGRCSPPAEASSSTRSDYFGSSSFASYPVVKVNLTQAQAYCVWAGRRLPSGDEWARAAGSATGKLYPWGNSIIDCNLANIKIGDHFCVGDTSAAGSYPSGATPLGVLDMAGNVFEWVTDACSQGNVVHGGSWNDGPEAAVISQTYCRTPDSASSKLGFRCVQ